MSILATDRPTAILPPSPHYINSSSFDGPPPLAFDVKKPKSRRTVSDGAAVLLSTAHDRDITSHHDDVHHTAASSPAWPTWESDAQAPLRSQASWMKRLSTQHSSPGSSLRPESRSVSYSNASAAFSNTGSVVPMLNNGFVQAPLPPNKLVKRSSSLRDVQRGTGSRLRPTLRRPATSHQRSADLHNRASILGMPETDLSFDNDDLYPTTAADESTRPNWRRFFGATVFREPPARKRNWADEDGQDIRRVHPHPKHQPALVLARTVTTTAIDVDDLFSPDQDSIYDSSRPATPGLDLQFNSSPLPHPIIDSLAESDRQPPRRSFSLSRVLPLGTPAWKLPRSSKANRSKLMRRSNRISSAPVGGTYDSNPSMTSTPQHESSEPPTKRRATPTSSHQNWNGSHHSLRSQPLDTPRQPSSAGRPSPGGSFALELNSPVSPLLPLTEPRYLPHDEIERSLALSGRSASSDYAAPARPLKHTSKFSLAATGATNLSSDDMDYESERLFDSLRTGVTRSTSGPRSPPVDTIFDDSPASPSGQTRSTLRDILPTGMLHHHGLSTPEGIPEEDEEIQATPLRPTTKSRNRSISPSSEMDSYALSNNPPSSPPDMKGLALVIRDRTAAAAAFDDDMWDESDQEQPGKRHDLTPSLAEGYPRNGPNSLHDSPGSHLGPLPDVSAHRRTPLRIFPDGEPKGNIFDWSEPLDKTPADGKQPRPRTVHGKKDAAEARGSRSVGRRVPSGVHTRSQSVPVVPEGTTAREPTTSKFGTWGHLGAKGVTEDWDEDFDFEESVENVQLVTGAPRGKDLRADSGMAMFVPQRIREHQSNVLANIGLLKEWGMLIEELKELRIRAAQLGILEGDHRKVFAEVDAMIDLADQEPDGPGLSAPRYGSHSPPSSPGFDHTAFEATPPTHTASDRKTSGHNRQKSFDDDEVDAGTNETAQIARIIRSSPTPVEVLTTPTREAHSPTPRARAESTTNPSNPIREITNRPRKDSEAVARSVIEALQAKSKRKKAGLDSQTDQEDKKVPFDTRTLRHIVPWVAGLKSRVKEAIRRAEGLQPLTPEKTIAGRLRLSELPRERESRSGERLSGLFIAPDDDEGEDWDQEMRDDNNDLTHRLQSMAFTEATKVT